MDVLIPITEFEKGTASVTIKDVAVGNYTVTEKTDWSWRYKLVLGEGESANKVVAVTSANGGAVSFTNKRDNRFWLSGDSYARNWWKSATEIIKN